VEAVAGKGDFEVEVVDVVGEGFGCAVELCALASGRCPGCLASLGASLALC
jgi:hypothetical protein